MSQRCQSCGSHIDLGDVNCPSCGATQAPLDRRTVVRVAAGVVVVVIAMIVVRWLTTRG